MVKADQHVGQQREHIERLRRGEKSWLYRTTNNKRNQKAGESNWIHNLLNSREPSMFVNGPAGVIRKARGRKSIEAAPYILGRARKCHHFLCSKRYNGNTSWRWWLQWVKAIFFELSPHPNLPCSLLPSCSSDRSR